MPRFDRSEVIVDERARRVGAKESVLLRLASSLSLRSRPLRYASRYKLRNTKNLMSANEEAQVASRLVPTQSSGDFAQADSAWAMRLTSSSFEGRLARKSRKAWS